MFVKGVATALEIQDVEHILNELAGVERVLIDTEDGKINIKYDDTQISMEHIAL
ncbi:hypothetical protein [Filobacillus milosensis]|uniref:hypothetical protein n=1 Tax=Filobacillus milosensis TaxID=94137 RepID=UPI001891B159|nr:hypothetical protein [Filobacillus milosensis]